MNITINSYIKVWEVKDGNRKGFKDARVSTQKKNKDGKYEQDFGGYMSFWVGKDGHATDNLVNGCSIKPGARANEESHYDKEKQREYRNINVFEFEIAEPKTADPAPAGDQATQTPAPAPEEEFVFPEFGDDDSLPFD
jgi:hypothetical protein